MYVSPPEVKSQTFTLFWKYSLQKKYLISDFASNTSKMLQLLFIKKNQVMESQLLKREERMKNLSVSATKNFCKLHLIFYLMLDKTWHSCGAAQICCPTCITTMMKSSGKLCYLLFHRRVYFLL